MKLYGPFQSVLPYTEYTHCKESLLFIVHGTSEEVICSLHIIFLNSTKRVGQYATKLVIRAGPFNTLKAEWQGSDIKIWNQTKGEISNPSQNSYILACRDHTTGHQTHRFYK